MRTTRLLAAATAALCLAASAALPTPASAAPSNTRLLLLLDSSGSMRDADLGGRPRIDTAREALNTVIGSMPDGANVGLRTFGATVENKAAPNACQDSQLKVPIAAGNKAALEGAVRDHRPFGETPLAFAMAEGVKDLGKDGQRTLLVISDGEDTCNPRPCDEARALARDTGLRIDVIGFNVAGKAQDDLRCIAEAGRGTYYAVGQKDDLATSLQNLSRRAFAGMTLTGTPVEGTPILDGAPTVTDGQWLSRIGYGGDERFYQVKKARGTSLHVSAAGRPRTGDAKDPEIRIELSLPDGTDCNVNASQSGAGVPISAATLVGPNHKCGQAENLILKVETNSGGKPQMKLDDTALAFELLLRTEKPVLNVNTLPGELGRPPQADDSWPYSLDGENVTGGAGFSDALPIQPNTTYRGTMLPGDVQFFKMPVRYGQSLTAKLNVAPPSQRLAQTLSAESGSLKFYIGTRNPMRGAINGDTASLYGSTTKRTVAGVTSTEVRWRNRFTPYVNEVNSTGLEGDYYIMVVAGQMPKGQAGDAIPFLVRGELTGQPDPAGQPEYAEPGAIQPTPTPTPTRSATPTRTPTPTASPTPTGPGTEPKKGSGSALPWLLGVLGLGALGGAGFLVWRSQRGGGTGGDGPGSGGTPPPPTPSTQGNGPAPTPWGGPGGQAPGSGPVGHDPGRETAWNPKWIGPSQGGWSNDGTGPQA